MACYHHHRRRRRHQVLTKSYKPSWLRGTVVERRSLAGELFLSCTARPVADGCPLMWVNRPL